jgi:hypothetical protein
VIMPHYRQAMALRILEASGDILRTYPEFPGRTRWIDRFFYRSEAGVAQSLATVWKDREPWVLRPATGILQFLAAQRIRVALRMLLVSDS